MKEIKLRFVNQIKKSGKIKFDYTSVNDLEMEDSWQGKVNYKRIDVNLFTGLIDKNGKDIYEGDIVRILYTDWASKSESDERTLQQYLIDIATIGVIEFNEDRFSVKTESKKYSDFNYSSIFAGQHGYIEVIGNIYENPELLK